MGPSFALLGVHISDGVLSPAWVIGGFIGMTLLLLPAMVRVRDEEIPRIALLTSAFFVASLIHVRLGPTSVHLLLNGLVGVILGWRAGLAIPVGLALQALLLGHGGFLTIGVNSCVLTLPALLCSGLFRLWVRFVHGGAVVPNFALGCMVGLVGVLLTLALNATVLLLGGAEDWRGIVVLVLLAHLPVAVLEGIILGFSVAFLARVKPDMLTGWTPRLESLTMPTSIPAQAVSPSTDPAAIKTPTPIQETTLSSPPALLLALAALLLVAEPAQAHRLDAEYRVLPDGHIQIESWFETGDAPPTANVQVFAREQLLTEGKLNAEGTFVFQADRSEPLRVVINAGAGHRKELTIPKREGEQPTAAADSKLSSRGNKGGVDTPFKEVLAGIGFLLAAAALALSVRNTQALREIQRRLSELQRKAD